MRVSLRGLHEVISVLRALKYLCIERFDEDRKRKYPRGTIQVRSVALGCRE